MKLLLDTCTFLWIAIDSPRLSSSARELFAAPANEVFLSVVSTWEIAVKTRLGKLSLPAPAERYIPKLRDEHGILSLPLDEEATLHEIRLPPIHRDPFDRMLICQAMIHGQAILTPDEKIAQYPVRSMW